MPEERLTKEEWYEKSVKEGSVYGIPFERFKEIFDLFNKDGYNIIDDEDFKKIKIKYFKK